MRYTITTDLWRGLRIRAVLSVNPPKDNPEYILQQTQQVRGRRGGSYTTLVFSPKLYLKLYSVGLETTAKVAIPTHLLKPFILQLQRVYDSIIERPEMYTVDENGALIIDHGLAKSVMKGLSLFEDKVYIMPAVVQDKIRHAKGILLMTSDNASISMTLYEATDLLETLNRLDPLTFTILLAILEEQFITSKKLDRIDAKLNDILKFMKGGQNSAKLDSGLGTPTARRGDDIPWRN